MMHVQFNRKTSSVINDRVIPYIQNSVNSLFLREKDAVTGTSTCYQGFGNKPDGSEIIVSKKDSRSTFDIRGDTNLGP